MGVVPYFWFVLGSLVQLNEALFEDQTGKFDWRVQRVGRVSEGVFDSISVKSSVPSKVVFVGSSDENVIAALSVKSGEIVWRQVLEQRTSQHERTDNNIDALLLRGRTVLSLSSGGQHLRAWGKVKGVLLWESPVSEEYCQNAQIVQSVTSSSESGVVTVLACDLLAAFGLKNGQKLWDVNLNQNQQRDVKWLGGFSTDDGDLYAVGGTPGQKVYVRSLNSWNGAPKHDKVTLEAPWFSEKKCALIQDSLICLDSTGVNVYILDLKNPTGPKLKNLERAAAELVVIDAMLGIFATKSGDKFTVWRNSQSGPIQAADLEQISCLNVIQEDPEVAGSVFLVVGRISVDRKRQKFLWIRASDGKEVSEWTSEIQLTALQAPFVKIFPSILKKTGGSSSARILGVSADGDLSFIQSNGAAGKVVWSRPESLASILSLEIVDLPLSEAQASIEKEFSAEADNIVNMLIRRLTSQAVQIKRSLMKAGDEILGLTGLIGADWLKKGTFLEKAGLLVQKTTQQEKGGSIFERDYFDLHKMIVVVTKSGKLFGLDNRNGQIIWQFWIEDLVPNETQELVLPLFVQRTTAHYPHPAQCLIVGKHKVSGKGYTVTFNPITGDVIDKQVLSFAVQQAVPLPYTNHVDIHGILLTDRDKYEGQIIPSDVVIPENSPIFVMKTEKGSEWIEGYNFVPDKRPKGSGKLHLAWRTILSLSPGQELVQISGKKITEKVHSQGRVLGDRSVLYKYANPNLVTIVGLGTTNLPSSDSETGKKPTSGNSQMTMFMVDGVNGQVVFSAQHPRAAAPVHVVHCENWVVYSYWNEKSRRTEISVLEFYEGKSQTDAQKFSSHTPLLSQPLVMRQSYVFPQGISALSVTDTEKGLTNRQILLAMPFGGILELPKNLLDPRRVLIPTKETMEEGLMPYVPDLPVATEHIFNYNQTALHIRKIQTAPSGLESTSLVVAYGLDMYFTRITPSGTFDILKEDFDHWFISAVLLALILASVVSKKLAKHRDLKQAWK